MPWSQSSPRRTRLPADWPTRRRLVLERDGYRCLAQGCTARATDVDHIMRGDNHQLYNLQSLCAEHHRAKTNEEAIQARARRGHTHRPTEPHPGLH